MASTVSSVSTNYTVADTLQLSLLDWAAAIREGKISSTACLELHLAAVAEFNPRFNAIVTLNPEAREQAAEADRLAQQGQWAGPLHGVPFTAKDTLAAAGMTATAGSPLLKDYVPDEDSTSVARLKSAGAILVGKTNCSEFAVATHSSNPVFGDTWNPWNMSVTSGGSSGGDSAAVASGMASFGVGTDFGGSIRWPAHCAGLTSMRPTVGLIPQTGMLPFVPGDTFPAPSSLSVLHRLGTIGWIARSTGDHQTLLELLKGPDHVDPNTVPAQLYAPAPVESLNCAWFSGEGNFPIRHDVESVLEAAASALADRGLSVVERRPPAIERAAEAFIGLRTTAGMPEVQALAAGREELVSEHLRESLLNPVQATVSDYRQAGSVRDEILREVLNFMEEHQILLLPVACVPAVDPRQDRVDVDGTPVAWSDLGSSCRAISILGFPVVVVPCGMSKEGLPVGVQVIGRPYDDLTVIEVAKALENSLGRFPLPRQ
ncbi:amidase [Glutamicibacter sp.]|uniref:amidase n=1 Tax=Glutamicibacter sp. TaxID=1931995 RepID=UPI0028BE6044|nr:amidase [Glutamicibacter sp.]